MGSWDATCAVTRVAIQEGEPVLMAYTPKTDRVYDLLSDLARFKDIQKMNVVNDPPGFAGFAEFQKKMTFEQREEAVVSWGTYNSYGWIEELPETVHDSREYNPERCFFVKAAVAKEIARVAGVDENDKIAVLKSVAEFAFLARIELYYSTLLGEQYFDPKEQEICAFYDQLRSSALSAILDEYKEVVNSTHRRQN